MAELFTDCVENNHNLAQVTAQHSDYLLAILCGTVAPAINVNHFVGQNCVSSADALDELVFNLDLKLIDLLLLLLRGAVPLSLELGG